jgi:small subunit ribosomal protein S7
MDNKEKLKKKFLKHILKNGKKSISEKILNKSFKFLQKSQKKSHGEILRLAILNSTPIFRIIKLKNKRRKKKSIKEIPAFLSTYKYRTSWGLKYLINTSNSKTNNTFSNQLNHSILESAKHTSNTITFKNELQNKALEKKKYFRHYRW